MTTNNTQILDHKIDFVAFVKVDCANPNGSPCTENMPRVDRDMYGYMSDVCIKRKIRNRMQDLGADIFVQSDERTSDGYCSLQERASKEIEKGEKKISTDEYAKRACERYVDVRSFGQVFAKSGFSLGIRGPVTVRIAKSLSPVDVESIDITKSCNNEDKGGKGEKASDTMGRKYVVNFGVYRIEGSINPYLAEKTGFTNGDAELIKECLRTLFVNDESSARPAGSMEVLNVYWFEHNTKLGQYPTSHVFKSVHSVAKEDSAMDIHSVDDYDIGVDELDGLSCEVLEGA